MVMDVVRLVFFFLDLFFKVDLCCDFRKIFYEKVLVLKYRVVVIKILLIIFNKYLNYVYCGYWF